MNESWNLDREPTLAERAVGIVVAALLCAFGGVVLWFSAAVLHSVIASIASGIFTALFAFVLIRFTSTKAQKPSQSQRLATARVVIIASVIMVILSFFPSEHGAQLGLISLGATGLVGGISNFARAKNEPNQSPEPMPLKRHGSS